MGQNSKIPWCHHTWNTWTGCEKVSAECKNCYAVTAPPVRIARSKGLEMWGANAPRQVASEKMWADPAKWNRLAASRGVRERVFVNSLSDFFEDYSGPSAEAVRAARERAFGVMRDCGQLDFLLLTKRPENILAMAPQAWLSGGWPQNVWVGTTAGTRETAAARIPLLRKVPAPVRFVSAEPLLEDVEWERYLHCCRPCRKQDPERIDPETGRCAFCDGHGQRGVDQSRSGSCSRGAANVASGAQPRPVPACRRCRGKQPGAAVRAELLRVTHGLG